MTLTDAGPLIALIDKGQGVPHQQCVEAPKEPPRSLADNVALFHRSDVLSRSPGRLERPGSVMELAKSTDSLCSYS